MINLSTKPDSGQFPVPVIEPDRSPVNKQYPTYTKDGVMFGYDRELADLLHELTYHQQRINAELEAIDTYRSRLEELQRVVSDALASEEKDSLHAAYDAIDNAKPAGDSSGCRVVTDDDLPF